MPNNIKLTNSCFKFSKIVIIESLKNEIKTGTELAGYIKGLDLKSGPEIQIIRISSGNNLISNLLNLEREARDGAIPLIHFEMHGTSDGSGLVTENLDVVSWFDISDILLRINLATKFNLIIFVAACNGGYFLEEMKIIAPTPCYALVAPTDEVDPSEIMRATRDFYRILLTTANATKAASIIVSQSIQQGRWFAQWAESWYRMVAIKYIKLYCTPAALKESALKINKKACAQGKLSAMGKTKKQLKNSIRMDLTGKYFDRFFCMDAIPENARRFEYLRKILSSEIDEFLSNPQASIKLYDEP